MPRARRGNSKAVIAAKRSIKGMTALQNAGARLFPNVASVDLQKIPLEPIRF